MLCLLVDIPKHWRIRASITLDVSLVTVNALRIWADEMDSTPRGPLRSYKASDELCPPHHRSDQSGCGRGDRAQRLRRCFIPYARSAI